MANTKVKIELVQQAMKKVTNDAVLQQKFMNKLLDLISDDVGEEKAPAVKKQFCILVSDTKGELEGKDLVGWVLQIPEEDSPATVTDRITKAAYEFNQSPKGRRLPVRTIGETCMAVSGKFFKDQKAWVKTKEPVLILTTDNNIPWNEGASE
jgi:hypothetical protein